MSFKMHIPDSVSDEAKVFLNQQPGPEESFPPTPAPDDFDAWQEIFCAVEKAYASLNDQVLQQFPVTQLKGELGGVPVLDIRPVDWCDSNRLILYFHGGAYTLYSAASSLCLAAPITVETGMRVISVDYTRAPFANFKQIIAQALAVVKALNDEGIATEEMVFMGDSAGGGLASGTVLALRDKQLSIPACLVLQSPWSDITESGDSYETLREHEPLYYYDLHLKNCALAYAGPDNLKHPYVSPVYANYGKGFVPTLIQGGTKEIFLSNFVRHYQALDQAGIEVKLDLYEGMIHDFMFEAPMLPESVISRQKTAKFIRRHLT